MNVEETRRYIERRMGDVGLIVRIDNSGYQAIHSYTSGDNERLNQLYYKLVSVGSRQEKREVNGVTIQIAIDDLRRMDEFMGHMPTRLVQDDKLDTDRITIEQLASSLEQKVAEEIEFAVDEVRRKGAETEADGGLNGTDHAVPIAVKTEAAVGTAGTPGKPCILVVDDSPTIRAAVTKALENDFELLQASDGERGWEILCANSQIKLVVTDLMMPAMDGFALIERIRSAKVPGVAGLPIIVVTALEDPQAKVHALVAGANDFITKRTDTLELQARVVARYQLSQIVGNAGYAAGTRPYKDAGPPPHEIAAALLGTRTSSSVSRNSVNIVGAARRHGKGGRASSSESAAPSASHDGEYGAGMDSKRPAARKGIGALGLERLNRVGSTTVITVVSSVLVVAAILGILYVNRPPALSAVSLGNAPIALTAARESIPQPADANAQSSEDGKIADPASTGTWTTADGSPSRESLPPAHSGSPVETAEETATVAAKPLAIPSERVSVSDSTVKPVPKAEPEPRASTTPAPVKPETVKTAAAPASAPANVARSAESNSTSAGATSSEQLPTVSAARPIVTDPASTAPPDPAPAATAESVTESPNTASSAWVATVGPPRADTSALPNPKLTKEELKSLVNRFVFVYQAGDIQQFLGLFDDNIRTNDRSTKAGLREDYEELFRSTAMRQMVLGDIAWDIKDRQASGAANFEVRIRRLNEDDLRVYQGSLTFHVEKADGRIRIIRMYHGQWKAQS
jgi:CheY-like chemotaxis protein